MSDERHSEVLGGLPRTRPHRRSDKRVSTGATPASTQATPDAEAATNSAPAAMPKPPPRKAKPKPRAAAPKAKAAPPKARRAPRAKKATAAANSTAGTARLRQPKQPEGTPGPGSAKPRPATHPAARTPAPPKRGEILGTAVQAAAELAEIGLSAGARALRRAVSRLPHP